jgi:Skp family chaperone for outer membrane proteins
MGFLRIATMVLALLAPQVASAQQFPVFQETLPIASLNREDLFNKSDYGRALLAQLNKKKEQLAAENTELYTNLEREELELTALRKQIPPEEFAPLAKAFDTKANKIRSRQRQKLADLNSQLEHARFTFFRHSETVIRNLMQETGILYVLNEQAILVSTGEGDITDEVIQRMDQMFANGTLTVEDK